jgi:hypothetical protein
MRRALMAAVSLFALGGASRILGQTTAAPSAAARDSFAQALDRERDTPAGRTLPSADRFGWGDLSIPAGTSVDGPVAVARGTVHVRGMVIGDVFAFGGDVVVHSGGEVTGSARAVQGKVILDGGLVRGAMRASAPLGRVQPGTAPLTGVAAVQRSLKLTVAWFTVVLTLTLVGVLLVPFAIVAFVLAVAGLVTLGALAAATVAGHAVVREGPNVRVRAIRSLVLGTVFLVLPWIAAALLVNTDWAGMLARLVAVALTWVAASAGFGAALMARGGVHRVQARVVTAVVAAGWQTPPPIGGVVAARRPTATPAAPTSVPR